MAQVVSAVRVAPAPRVWQAPRPERTEPRGEVAATAAMRGLVREVALVGLPALPVESRAPMAMAAMEAWVVRRASRAAGAQARPVMRSLQRVGMVARGASRVLRAVALRAGRPAPVASVVRRVPREQRELPRLWDLEAEGTVERELPTPMAMAETAGAVDSEERLVRRARVALVARPRRRVRPEALAASAAHP